MTIPSTEAKIQQEIFIWYNNTFCLRHHSPRNLILSIPNEGQQHLTGTGVYPGASDMLVIHYPHAPIFLEVKTPTGRQSEKQVAFEAHVTSLGYSYHLVRSLSEFQNIIYSLTI